MVVKSDIEDRAEAVVYFDVPPEVVEAMKAHGVPYLAAVGGAGALIARSIRKYTVLAYEDLGPEAVAALEVEDFPAIVVIDSTGDNYYETGQAPYREL